MNSGKNRKDGEDMVNTNNHGQEYLTHLIQSIERIKRNSIKKHQVDDLYTDKELLTSLRWYHDIVLFVKANPPKFFVKYLIIKQHGEEKMSIEYSMFNSDEQIHDSEIILECSPS